MAPELVKNQEYDSKVDIWALGVLTYIIMTGTEPFKGHNQAEVFEAIKKKKLNYEPLKDFYMKGQHIRSFLVECFASSPENRPTAEQLLQHPWLKDMVKKD